MRVVVLAGCLTLGVCPLAARAGGSPAQDLAPLQRPSLSWHGALCLSKSWISGNHIGNNERG